MDATGLQRIRRCRHALPRVKRRKRVAGRTGDRDLEPAGVAGEGHRAEVQIDGKNAVDDDDVVRG